MFLALSTLLFCALPAQEPDSRPHVVFVTGDEEYRSEESMPLLAELLEREYGCRTTVLYAQDEHGFIAPNHLTNIPGLEALETADLMVQFTRFRALPEDQFQMILDYAQSGRPMVGFRTSTHAFLYPKGHPLAKWNDRFSVEFFGQRWITHHGHRSTTRAYLSMKPTEHPVLQGVEEFEAPSWLYHVSGGGDKLPDDAKVLLDGLTINSSHVGKEDRFPVSQPLAWVRERENGQRVFFTTLGHPGDFEQESMRTLSLNGIMWALGREEEIPIYGCAPILFHPFRPTADAYGGAVPGRRPEGLPEKWEPRQGAQIAFVGNTLAERMSFFGGFESALHRAFPTHKLHVRNLGWSADTMTFQPRPAAFGTMEEHLEALQSDTIFAFFGFNESFAGEEGLPEFRKDLEDFVRRIRGRRLADGTYPELILVSPIAPENVGGRYPSNLPLLKQLEPYVDAMEEVAERCQVRFLNDFRMAAYAPDETVYPEDERKTINGIHLNEMGHMELGMNLLFYLTQEIPYPDDNFMAILQEVRKKSQYWWYRHRAINGYYIYGGRKDPFGSVSFPGEMHNLDLLVAAHDLRIHALAQAEDLDAVPEVNMAGLPPLPTIPSNFTKDITILSPEEAEASMTMAEGYQATVFASEVDFPQLENPVAMTFDGQGRLWVSVMPTYPQVVPGEEPNGKLLIFEDTTGDHRADEVIVFADKLYLPAGFELGDGGAYVAQQPNLLFLKDLDGDDRADTREVVLQGFGTEDSHHAISAFTWGPGGGLYMQEGTFHHSQVETPYGPVRVKDGAVFRWEPHTGRLRVHTPFGFWNPWGHVFDAYGQDYIGDASDGNNYIAAPITTDKEYHRYRRGLEPFTTARVRPTGGAEIVTGHMFPQSVQGDFLVTNTIGFQGIRGHHLAPDGSGVKAESHWDLLSSPDPNFRPIDLQFGPDGALYFVDWFNPLIGHMQHSIRDPKRDHSHGRVWRVSYVGEEAAPARRPEATEQAMGDLSKLTAAELLPFLADSDTRLRYRVRREFRTRPAAQIEAAMNEQPPIHELHALEHFWVRQQAGLLKLEHAQRMYRSQDARVRAAVVRALSMEKDNPVFAPIMNEFLGLAALDEAPQVRLEAASLATRVPGEAAVEAVLQIAEGPRDRWLDYAIDQALLFLKPQWLELMQAPWLFLHSHPQANQILADRLSTEELVSVWPTEVAAGTLLMRPDASAEQRRGALEVLGRNKEGAAPAATAWLEALRAADQLPTHQPSGLHELLVLFEAQALATLVSDLEPLAFAAKRAEVRVSALAAIMKAQSPHTKTPLDPSAPPGDLWKRCIEQPQAMVDALQASRLLGPIGAASRANYLAFLIQAPHAWPGCPDQEDVVRGSVVRITLPAKRPLTLAEVEVWSGGENIGPRGTATQSSEAWGGVAQRALDGNRSGQFGDGGQTHTAEGVANSWWQVDLGADFPLEEIVLWNRTEGQHGERLEGYQIQIFDQAGREVWADQDCAAPKPVTRHTLHVDWPGLVRREAIRAIAAGKTNPFDFTFRNNLFSILDQVPVQERGLPWFQAGLTTLRNINQEGFKQAQSLEVQLVEFVAPVEAATSPSVVWTLRAGGMVELRLTNQTSRYQAYAMLSAAAEQNLAIDEAARFQPTEEQQNLFRMHCLSCHAADGGGLVGPNMTDDYYLHLRNREDMIPLVRDGLIERGMLPFQDTLTEREIELISAYMADLRGTTPASPKEAQGELVQPWEGPAQRLARLQLDAIFTSPAIAPGESVVLQFRAPKEAGTWLLTDLLPGRSMRGQRVAIEK